MSANFLRKRRLWSTCRQRENSDIRRSDLWLWRGRVPHDVLIASQANQLVLNASNVTDIACTENARSAIERHNRRCLRWEQAGLRLVYSGFSVACVENKLVCGKFTAGFMLLALRTSWFSASYQLVLTASNAYCLHWERAVSLQIYRKWLLGNGQSFWHFSLL